MKTSEKQYTDLEKTLTALFKELKGQIGSEYRASDDDMLPSMQVTIGATPQDDGTLSWSYQTGDNSYTGGAYSHRHWGVVSLYRKSKSADVAHDCVEQIADSIANCMPDITDDSPVIKPGTGGCLYKRNSIL